MYNFAHPLFNLFFKWFINLLFKIFFSSSCFPSAFGYIPLLCYGHRFRWSFYVWFLVRRWLWTWVVFGMHWRWRRVALLRLNFPCGYYAANARFLFCGEIKQFDPFIMYFKLFKIISEVYRRYRSMHFRQPDSMAFALSRPEKYFSNYCVYGCQLPIGKWTFSSIFSSFIFQFSSISINTWAHSIQQNVFLHSNLMFLCVGLLKWNIKMFDVILLLLV